MVLGTLLLLLRGFPETARGNGTGSAVGTHAYVAHALAKAGGWRPKEGLGICHIQLTCGEGDCFATRLEKKTLV